MKRNQTSNVTSRMQGYLTSTWRFLLSATWLVTFMDDVMAAACDTCIRGTCDTVTNTCICEPYILGGKCEQLDLTSAIVSVGSRTALFLWINKKVLPDFIFICYRHIGEGTIFRRDAEPYKTGIIAKELTSSSKYTICAVHQNQSSNILRLVSTDAFPITGCVEVETSRDNSSTYKMVAVITACFLIGFVILLIIARFVFLCSHRKTLTFHNMPKIDNDEQAEHFLFDFLDGALQMDDARGRMIIRTISRQNSSLADGTQDVKVEFFNSRDRREVFRMAKLQNQEVNTSFGNVTLKPGKGILRHSRSMSESQRVNIGQDQLAVTI